MTKEIWKDIEGYEGLYQVSNKRRVKSFNYRNTGKEEIKKPQKNNWGYLLVQLSKDKKIKNYTIHRLVAQAFIPNLEKLPQVNHKDENPLNNCVENLEWCTCEYNNNYGTKKERLSKFKSIPVMCVETGEIFSSAKEAQERTGIFATHICACARHEKRRHTARRFHWEYLNKEDK